MVYVVHNQSTKPYNEILKNFLYDNLWNRMVWRFLKNVIGYHNIYSNFVFEKLLILFIHVIYVGTKFFDFFLQVHKIFMFGMLQIFEILNHFYYNTSYRSVIKLKWDIFHSKRVVWRLFYVYAHMIYKLLIIQSHSVFKRCTAVRIFIFCQGYNLYLSVKLISKYWQHILIF